MYVCMYVCETLNPESNGFLHNGRYLHSFTTLMEKPCNCDTDVQYGEISNISIMGIYECDEKRQHLLEKYFSNRHDINAT